MDPKMEGVQKRLREHHDKIDIKDSSVERAKSAVADISGIDASVTPPPSLIKAIEGREGFACAQAFEIRWDSGPQKGLPVTLYCAEPLCRTTGQCTGTRFVPHVDQFITLDGPIEQRERRVMEKREIIRSVHAAAKEAAKQTGRDEDRTDSEILEHVQMTWRKTLAQIRDRGQKWRR